MAHTTNAAEYFCGGSATNDEIDDFLIFSTMKYGGKKTRYEVHRFWARMLRHHEHLIKNMKDLISTMI